MQTTLARSEALLARPASGTPGPAGRRAALRIGIDGRFLQDKYQGGGRYTYGVVSRLASLPGEFEAVVFFDPKLPNSRFPLDSLPCGKIELQPIDVSLYSPREVWAWVSILRRGTIDVFHSPFFWSPVLLSCPLITTVHDMIFDHDPKYIPGRRFMLPYVLSSRLAIRRAARVITVSDATRRDVQRFTGVRSDKLVSIPEGVEPVFRPVRSPETRAAVRAAYQLPERFVLALGARRPHKNIRRLVEAFRSVVDQVPHSLVLVGSIDERFPDDTTEAIAALRQVGRVIEIAHVAEDDLPALYSAADLFVQPSIIEGFGLPVLEAMACGVPVACSNTSSLPEIAGDAAWQFDPCSIGDLVEALSTLLRSEERRQLLAQRSLRLPNPRR